MNEIPVTFNIYTMYQFFSKYSMLNELNVKWRGLYVTKKGKYIFSQPL